MKSDKIELTLRCPECGQPLYTDILAKKNAWCLNEDCPLFVKRRPPFDLMFSYIQESFLCFSKEEMNKK